MIDHFDAGVALSALAEQKITRMTLVPPMLYAILDHPDWPGGRCMFLIPSHWRWSTSVSA